MYVWYVFAIALTYFITPSEHRPHRLFDHHLQVNLGFQGSVTVRLDNIEAVHEAKSFELGAKVPDDIFVSLMRLDAPQFEICLQEPVQMQGSYGVKKMISKIVLRVDHASDFIAELEEQRVISARNEFYQ
ncbi:hypothetical protein [Paenibacillus sp. 481]|uniref:hypothetical protein n=1 Tax=Paenibacillus sp. 481 TaxID=2835869 RepID=UPI001E5DD2C2|nr:hypothetical protein [Paenibacillus sp. 481]UHA73127.1 hypothetical protein KIK04_21430 [Paenibacillus sp. 481]